MAEKLAHSRTVSRYLPRYRCTKMQAGGLTAFPPTARLSSAVMLCADILRYGIIHTRTPHAGRHMAPNDLYDVQGAQASGRATTVVTVGNARQLTRSWERGLRDDLAKVNGEWKMGINGSTTISGVRSRKAGQPSGPSGR